MPRLSPALLVLLLPACAHRADDPNPVEAPTQAVAPTPPDAAPPPPPIDGLEPPPEHYEIQTTNKCPGKPVHVEAVKVEGNQLYVDVGASGCTAPEIWACWNRRFMLSKPPRVAIEIHQSDTGDCEPLIRSTERFDLGPIVVNAGSERVVIHVGDLVAGWNR
jgi:hypothetical protein